MTWPVFQSLLVEHIWMLLLLQTIFWEGTVLMLLYLIVDHLHGCFSCFRGLFQQFQISSYNLPFKLSFIAVFFRMVRNEKLFRRPSVKYWTFSESPTWCNNPAIKQYTWCLKLKLLGLLWFENWSGGPSSPWSAQWLRPCSILVFFV